MQETVFGHARFQAEQNLRAPLCADRMPHFGFTAATGMLFVPRGISVAGVYLNGEFVIREKKFDENREFRGCRVPRAAPICRHRVPTLTQGPAGKWPVCKPRVERRQPSLAEGLLQIYLVRKPRRQGALAPDARTEKRLKARKNGFHLQLRCRLRSREEFFQTAQPFFDALERGGIGKAQITRRTERFSANQGHVGFF